MYKHAKNTQTHKRVNLQTDKHKNIQIQKRTNTLKQTQTYKHKTLKDTNIGTQKMQI